MSDLIDRQAAIEHLKKRLYETALNSITEHPYYEDMADNRVDVWMNELPSIDPERKKGKWIIKDNPGTGWYRVTCSECGEDVTSVIPMIGFFPNVKALWNFCPDCGAEMRERKEDAKIR